MTKNIRKFVFGILGVVFFLNILAWVAVFELAKPQFLAVHFLILARLKNFDIKALRTDQKGDIKIFTDRENFKI